MSDERDTHVFDMIDKLRLYAAQFKDQPAPRNMSATLHDAANLIWRLQDQISQYKGMVTPKLLDSTAPKDRVLIGVERPPYEDKTYYYMVQWREGEQTWMTECGVDWDTGKYRYAFCGVSHYLDPLELPGLPYWEGKEEETEPRT